MVYNRINDENKPNDHRIKGTTETQPLLVGKEDEGMRIMCIVSTPADGYAKLGDFEDGATGGTGHIQLISPSQQIAGSIRG